MLKPIIILSMLGWATAGAQAEVRNPTDKWNVNFADAQCVASRAYGTAEKPLHLALKAPPLGDVMQIVVMKEASGTEAQQVEATIGLDGGQALKTNMLMFSPPKKRVRAYVLNMPAANFGKVRQAKNLAIRSQGLNEIFALSQMEPLLKIMDDCVADLREVWNVQNSDDDQSAPPQQSALPRRAIGSLQGIIKADDYPAVAINERQTGMVRVAILIDESGRIADCTIIQTSAVASLDAQTCAIVKTRAKFQPALDASGKPTKDAHLQSVTWRIAL